MTLVFVYNADSGRLNLLLDIAHKVLRPQTYACSLCAITHDALSEKQAWRAFRERTQLDLQFHHRDEFEARYKVTFPYPTVLRLDAADQLHVLLDPAAIAAATDVDTLIARIEDAAEVPNAGDGDAGSGTLAD